MKCCPEPALNRPLSRAHSCIRIWPRPSVSITAWYRGLTLTVSIALPLTLTLTLILLMDSWALRINPQLRPPPHTHL